MSLLSFVVLLFFIFFSSHSVAFVFLCQLILWLFLSCFSWVNSWMCLFFLVQWVFRHSWVYVYRCAYEDLDDWSVNVCLFMPMLPREMAVNDPSAFTQSGLLVSWVPPKKIRANLAAWIIFNLTGCELLKRKYCIVGSKGCEL